MPCPVATTFERASRAWIVFCAGLLMTASVVTYMWNSTRNVLRLKAANDSVSALARTDPLTGLANRRAFLEQLARAFAGAARGNNFFAVHFVDLDEFKDVNDTQGHETGDLLLKEVAARLTNAVRAEDVVARFGGDEFAVLQVDAADRSAAGVLAERIVKALAAPYTLNGVEQRVTASIGVAPHSAAVEGPKEMLMQADLALYRAKADGRNCFRFHTGELDQQVHLRVDLAEQLRAGIDRGELELHYQPQVEIRSGEIVGLEAQLRWNHPTRGEIRPSIFVPVAERTGGIRGAGTMDAGAGVHAISRMGRQAASPFPDWRSASRRRSSGGRKNSNARSPRTSSAGASAGCHRAGAHRIRDDGGHEKAE